MLILFIFVYSSVSAVLWVFNRLFFLLFVCYCNIYSYVSYGLVLFVFFFFQAEDGIRDLVRSRGLGDVYKRQGYKFIVSSLSERRDRDSFKTSEGKYVSG